MATLNPYLCMNGNVEEAFNFYRSIFGGEFINVQRFKDVPGGDKMSAADQQKLIHISLPINSHSVLMGSDAPESMNQKITFGDNFNISVGVDSKEEADKIYHGLLAGGKVLMPLDMAFWGDYFGMLKDKFGIQWMVSFTPAKG